MSLLEHPTARALLADAEVSADAVASCPRRLQRFLRRYLPCFYRVEQHELARVVLQGKLSGLQRKTSEPIAYQAGRPRKPVQHFVGGGKWDDEAVMAELRRHVAQEAADPDAVLVLDGSGFPKSGSDSCGVQRQWCGRLGKVENCQLGVFLAYVGERGQALVDRRLYLPKEWAQDRPRRRRAHVPPEVTFREFGHTSLRRLSAEQLLDALAQATGIEEDYPGLPAGFRAAQIPTSRTGSYFLKTFGRPPRKSPCACERSQTPTLPQILHLMNGPAVQGRLRAEGGTLNRLLKAGLGEDELVSELYVNALSRPPTPAELTRGRQHLREAPDRAQGAEDLFWALLNSRQFLFNH